MFELPHRPSTRPRANLKGVSCDFKGDLIDPNVLQSQYGYPEPSEPRGGISQGVAAFEDAEFSPDDVKAFEAYCESIHPNLLPSPHRHVCRGLANFPRHIGDLAQCASRRVGDNFSQLHASMSSAIRLGNLPHKHTAVTRLQPDAEPIPLRRSPSQRESSSEGAEPWRVLR